MSVEIGGTARINGKLFRKEKCTRLCEGCWFLDRSKCPCGVDGGDSAQCAASLEDGGNDCEWTVWVLVEESASDHVDAKMQELKEAVETAFPDPKTKYLRDIYPVDSEVHEDAQGRKYVKVDVYSVLRAFGVDHPTGHAVKKLLCAGLRGKGDRIQDLTEAKVAIDRAIQEAGI